MHCRHAIWNVSDLIDCYINQQAEDLLSLTLPVCCSLSAISRSFPYQARHCIPYQCILITRKSDLASPCLDSGDVDPGDILRTGSCFYIPCLAAGGLNDKRKKSRGDAAKFSSHIYDNGITREMSAM
jgi:hypothetical protein